MPSSTRSTYLGLLFLKLGPRIVTFLGETKGGDLSLNRIELQAPFYQISKLVKVLRDMGKDNNPYTENKQELVMG